MDEAVGDILWQIDIRRREVTGARLPEVTQLGSTIRKYRVDERAPPTRGRPGSELRLRDEEPKPEQIRLNRVGIESEKTSAQSADHATQVKRRIGNTCRSKFPATSLRYSRSGSRRAASTYDLFRETVPH
jgi:hypothetical protein